MNPSGENQHDNFGLGDPIYVRVCQRIRSDILSGELAPGQRLKISELIKRYGVKQMPIREALQQLQGEWLVTISPNRGACVRAVDELFIDHMYEIRGHLESLLSRRCAESASEEEIHAIAALHAEWERVAVEGDIPAAMAANRDFHRAIYQFGRNPVAMELLDRHFGLLYALRRIYGFGADRFAHMVAEHRQLLDALAQHDGVLAEKVARQHCDSARDDLFAQMRKNAGRSCSNVA